METKTVLLNHSVQPKDQVEARVLHQDHYLVQQEVLALGLNRLVFFPILMSKVKMRKLEDLLVALRVVRLRLVPLLLAKLKPQWQKQQ